MDLYKDCTTKPYSFLVIDASLPLDYSCESAALKYFNGSKAFIEYSNDMNDIYKKLQEYNPNEKRKILIVFGDTIADMLSNKKVNPIVTDLFVRGRKLKIYFVFMTESYFALPKNIILNSTHYSIMNISNKQDRRSRNHI